MAPVTPPFADVLNSYMRHVVREFYPEPAVHEELEKAIRSYIVNLQRENTSESEIYELLAEMNPALGNPLTFYEEFVMKYDESYKNVAKAQKKAEKEARTLASRALMELTNKRKCHELEQSTRNKQSKSSELTTPSLKHQEKQVLDITPGSYVCVEPDLSPGMPPKMPHLTSIQSILAAGATRGKHKGWRAKQLGAVEHGRRNKRFNILLREDTKEMLGFLSGRSTAGGGTGGVALQCKNV
jgi:hypothetical protein